MTTIRPRPDSARNDAERIPIRMLTAEQIEAGRSLPAGPSDDRARRVVEILRRSTFSVPARQAPRPSWYL